MYYIETDEGGVRGIEDVLAWAEWMETHDRAVALDTLGHCDVSTVFLGSDYRIGDGLPILYETLVFGGPLDGEMERYCTRAEALEGHGRMVERVQVEEREVRCEF